MTIVGATTLRNNLADTLSEVKKQDYLLIAKRGKITSAIVDIDLFEDLMASANKDYLESIKQARKEFERGEYFTFDEVFGKI